VLDYAYSSCHDEEINFEDIAKISMIILKHSMAIPLVEAPQSSQK
jgi:hypothetical protein